MNKKTRILGLLATTVLAGTILAGTTVVQAQQTRLTVATVNNGDMIVMQKLSSRFEQANPDIKLDWVVLEENVLRQRVTTDIATKGGQYDVLTIGTYEVPIWAKQGWIKKFDNLSADYDVADVLKPVREGLSYEGTLYALPFYAESSMTYYRTDLVQKTGLTMPERPTYDQIKEIASKIHDPANQVYGICLRGKPGWGENMAFLSTMVNTFGGQWFDKDWNTKIESPEWKQAVSFYIDLLKNYGPPGASSNGFNENLAMFSNGQCGIWIDATVAAGMVFNPATSKVSDKLGFAQAPVASWPKGSNWLWSWALAVPESSKKEAAAKKFVTWATSKEYIKLVGETEGWVSAPPGTRASTYDNKQYVEAAPFAKFVEQAIETADPINTTKNPKSYVGVQFAGIPEFQAIGTQTGQTMAAALTGQMTVDQALKTAQSAAERAMRQAGYKK
ncbi:sugar ABC transporter substrate-binding protein [Skermanella stibiiresistens SB22]|uniref:Sugar ABC transporter substrate-binding protein n=1 Tax=Skermanella stibiiresistens SB22 TaxID=1385369 RepID=W9H5Q0_9PROT|nr:sugar ABC transporter substrate-binding protein [Skermanella stibiiresistens]EWY39083.1 sugar ABC transporter substrate-binding protein [Skermanella stibiiresistens SB22]